MSQANAPLTRIASTVAAIGLSLAAARKVARRGSARESRPADGDGGGGDRGQGAAAPREIPARGWWDVLKRVWREAGEDNVWVIAAGCAFFSLLSIFPFITALVSIYGLVADPTQVEEHATMLQGLLPAEAYELIVGQLHDVAASPPTGLGLSLVISIGLALWSASAAVKCVFAALNIAYEEEETRSLVAYHLTALAFTVGGILVILIALGTIIVVPVVLNFIGLGTFGEWLIRILRWPLLGALVILGFAVLYRWGPSRSEAKWRWVTWGSAVATVLWLLASIAFSFYVANFGNYNETYGSLGAVIVVLMWLYVSAYVVLLGAELNSELEHQTARDTTTGPEQPRGTRGAWVADNVAQTS
ncbi:MAG TPA: YihY/virulence factor BrkB family protein [Geminicoccaceae bacterium]|nr:YihY/virulence factor BrkB family protein [Geminicoccaceae bacterium]